RPGAPVPLEPRLRADVRLQRPDGAGLAARSRRPRPGRAGLPRPRPGPAPGADAGRPEPDDRRDRMATEPRREEPPVHRAGAPPGGRSPDPRRELRGARPADTAR